MSAVSLFLFNAFLCRVIKLKHNEMEKRHQKQSIVTTTLTILNFTAKPYQGLAKLHQILWPKTRALKGFGKTIKTTDWNKELGTPPCPQLSWKDFLTTCWNNTRPLAFFIYSRAAKQSNNFRMSTAVCQTLSEHFEHPGVLNNLWPRDWANGLEQYPVF